MNALATLDSDIDIFLRWGAEARGSTRPLGLIRIGIAVVLLARFGNELSLYQGESISFVALGIAFFACTSMMLVGFKTQAATAAVALTLVFMHFYMGRVEGQPGWDSHHIYLLIVSTGLLAMSPCGQSYSLDRFLAVTKAGRTNETVPEWGFLWPQRLMALQLAVLYFWTAVDKTNWSFLSGERLQQAFVWSYSGRVLEPLISAGPLLPALAILVVLVEYALAFTILIPRCQKFVLPVGLSLHAAFYVLLPVSTYSATMMVLYLALLDPDVVHNALDRLQGHGDASRHI
jgi:hypothetical protein